MLATSTGEAFPDNLHFEINGSTLATTSVNNQQQQLRLIGQGDEMEAAVYAYQKVGDEQVLAGQLNLISYEELRRELVIVPVNEVIAPNADLLQQALNKIYQQAVVQWQVRVDKKLEVSAEVLQDIDQVSSGMLTNYPQQMKKIIQAYRQDNATDKEAYYLFLIDQSTSAKAGFMPKKRQYGFIFTKHLQGQAQVKTIAHELAHGAFRLEHTFETYPSLTQGSTDNLMDYSSQGTRLRKYQWDLIHDPVKMLGWFQQDEDGAMNVNLYGYIWEELNGISSNFEYKIYQINTWFSSAKQLILSWFDFPDVELTAGNEKVKALLTTIKNSNETLKDYNYEESILLGSDLEIGEKVYDKIVVYFLAKVEEIDLKNYTTTESKEEEYTLLVLKEKDTDKEVIKIKVANNSAEKMEEYLFGGKLEEIAQDEACTSGFCCTKCGRDLTITLIRLQQIFPNSTLVANNGPEYATLFNNSLQIGGFNTCDRQAKLFSQIGHESGGFNATVEGKKKDGTERNWSLAKILSYFKRTKGAKRNWFNQDFWDNKEYKKYITANYYETAEKDTEGTHKSEATKDYYGIWDGKKQSQYHVKISTQFKSDKDGNYVKYIVPETEKNQHLKDMFRNAYGGSLGNNDPNAYPNTKDGWIYRGKGAIQLTGKDNYRLNQNVIAKWFNVNYDFVNDPDLVATNKAAIVYSAIAYILQNVSKIEDIDDMSIDEFSALVNTGNSKKGIENVNGAEDRKTRYQNLVSDEVLFKCEKNSKNEEREDTKTK